MSVVTALDAASLRGGHRAPRGDAVFAGLARAAGVIVFGILGAIAVFLIVKALPALHGDKSSFLTTRSWSNVSGTHTFGIAALAYGTVITSLLALVMAVPVAIGVAIYITEYAPRRISNLLGYATDMLASVPSVVYGLWGFEFFIHHSIGVQSFLSKYFGWIPLFNHAGANLDTVSKSIFNASIVLAIMILPIVAAISREVFRQVDPATKEAALALGATRWEMLRMSVLKRSTAGIFGASLLGLGRAFGETIAVTMLIGNSVLSITTSIFGQGATMPSVIANEFTEATEPFHLQSLFVVGTLLLFITLIVNLLGKLVVSRISETIA